MVFKCEMFRLRMLIILLLSLPIILTWALINESQHWTANNITAPINDFTFALFDKLRELNQTNNNVFYSPLTISSIFAGLLLGSRGETQKELFEKLFFARYYSTPDTVHPQFGQRLDQIQKELVTNRFRTSNHLWIEKGSEVRTEFETKYHRYYNGSIHLIDFTNLQQSFKSINSTIADETKTEMESKVVKPLLDERTKLIHVNPVYFKGSWQTKFNEENTQIRQFDNFDGSFSQVPFMTIENRFGIHRNKRKQYRLLELKYNDGLSLYILLPYYKTGLAKVLQKMTREDLLAETESLRLYEIYLPRFKVKNTHSLRSLMVSLGVSRVFQSSQADLGNMCKEKEEEEKGRGIYLSDSIHESMMEADEEGSVGEATTGTDLLNKQYVPRFIINRPFMFFIRNNSNGLIYGFGLINKL